MKTIHISVMAIAAALMLVGSIGLLSIQYQQQVWAPRECPGCVISEFKQVTHEFEKNVITAISEGNLDEVGEDLDEFVLFMRALPIPPSELDDLISNYEDGVRRVLSAPPPDDGKPHDQIKEFRDLTHTFERAVIGAVSVPPSPV